MSVTVVLPCLDEAASLPGVLAAVPSDYQALVVDNGSTDGSPEVAHRLGAVVVHEPVRGYGAAVHAGIEAARTDLVAVIDCDGSMDPGELVGPVATVSSGRADLVCGRRRPVQRGSWPWHARAGNAVLAAMIRLSTGVSVHDIAPVRVARRSDLLALGLRDRRFGYPLETVLAAAQSGWRVLEVDITYRRRSGGRSKVSGTVRGTVRVAQDFWRVIRDRHGWRRPGRTGYHPRVHSDSIRSDPAHRDPAHPDPAHSDPAHRDPAHRDPAHLDPAHLDPAHLDAVRPESGSPEAHVAYLPGADSADSDPIGSAATKS